MWEKGITGKGVVVCIIDDGVDHQHKDIAPAFVIMIALIVVVNCLERRFVI